MHRNLFQWTISTNVLGEVRLLCQISIHNLMIVCKEVTERSRWCSENSMHFSVLLTMNQVLDLKIISNHGLNEDLSIQHRKIVHLAYVDFSKNQQCWCLRKFALNARVQSMERDQPVVEN